MEGATDLWDDARLPRVIFAHHGVTFASSCLSIGKDAHIVALEGMLQHLNANVIIDLLLVNERRVFRL